MKKKKKGLIIGMTALALTGSLAGLVGGYCIPRKGNVFAPGNSSNVSQEKEFAEYALPENMTIGNLYVTTLTDRYSLASSAMANVTYLIDKETKEFTFLFAKSLNQNGTPVSDIVNNKCLINLGDGSYDVRILDLETKEFSRLDIGDSATATTTFMGKSGNEIYMQAGNQFCVIDTQNGTTRRFDVKEEVYTSNMWKTSVLNLKDWYIASYSYDTVAKMFIISKETGEVTVNNECSMTEGLSAVKDNGVYFASIRGDFSGRGIYYLNLTNSECTKLHSYDFGNYDNWSWKAKEFESGLLFFNDKYQLQSQFVKFADNSVTVMEYGNVIEYCGAVFGGFQNSGTTSNKDLMKFNASTGTWDVLYTANTYVQEYQKYSFEIFNGNLYAQLRDGSSGYFVNLKIDNKLKITTVSIPANSFSWDKITLSDNEFIFHGEGNGEGVVYYNDKTDVMMQLALNVKLEDYSVKGDVVSLFTSDGFKREFNKKTMVLKTVAVCEEV